MQTPAPQLFTAAQIAAALGVERTTMLKRLQKVMPDSLIDAAGNQAAAWSLASMPADIQRQLEVVAESRHFRNSIHLLNHPDEVPVPKREDLQVQKNRSVTLGDESCFRILRDGISSFRNQRVPSVIEKSWFWMRVLEVYEEHLQQGRAPKKLRRSLMNFLLHHAPFLVSAKSSDLASALRVNFGRKYAAWVKQDRKVAAVVDKRANSSGRWRGPQLSDEDRDKIISHAVFNCGGRVAQAWRELNDRTLLSESILEYYLSNPSRKSHVPRRIMEAVKYEVASMYDLHHGPRQSKLNGAHISRDWSTVAAGDWFQADDFTMPVYYSVPDGQGWFDLMRGQVLLMIDLRSTRILGFVLISARNYTAGAIRSLITKVAMEHGLPRKGFYFENGIWKNAKIIKGDGNGEPATWGEAEVGLKSFGLRFVHSQLPRSKPVERVGGAVQNLMEGLPGYVGRNEMVEKFERVQRLKLEVESRKRHPDGHFLTEEEYLDALEKVCHLYNADRQDGKMTCGFSPDDAYNRFLNHTDPPIRFTPDVRYLLAHHRRVTCVTRNGVTLRFGNVAYNYCDANLMKLTGQNVLTWFDPDAPEILTVTDMNKQNAICVSLTQQPPAMDAPPEMMAREMKRVASIQSHMKARYRILKSARPVKFRGMVVDRDTAQLGADIERKRGEIIATERAGQQHEQQARTVARKLNMSIPSDRLRRPETAPALRQLEELLREDEPTDNSNPSTT